MSKTTMLNALYEKAEVWAEYCKESEDETTPYEVVVSSLKMNDWGTNFVIYNNEGDNPTSIVDNFIFSLDEIYGFKDCHQSIDWYLSSLSKNEYKAIEFDDLVGLIVSTAYQSI